jgi:uncharacterized repeat protein (TIGR03803 family)
MRTSIQNPFLLPVLIVSRNLLLAGRAPAQTFTNLHSFGSTPTDGLQPSSGLVLAGNILYGTTDGGGSSSNGAVFSVHTDGTGYTNLYSFTAAAITNSPGFYTNSDGSEPGGGYVPGSRLVLWGNILYGTAAAGGSGGQGTIFKVHTDGTGFTNLHSFTALDASFYTNSDGANPDNDLILSNNTLYGTAYQGGSSNNGVVFRVNTDGTGFTNLHSFTDSYGDYPVGGLILSGNILYGTTDVGGSAGNGTVFAVNTDGTGFTNLYSFSAISSHLGTTLVTNSDGANPDSGLVLSGSTLYGTTSQGGMNGWFANGSNGYNGSYGSGTVFKINTDGTGFTNLHSFAAATPNPTSIFHGWTNSEGTTPYAGLIVLGNTLYGTANNGGSSGNGTVFALNTDGTGFTVLYNFTAGSINSSATYTNSDGAGPYWNLNLSGNILYGTTTSGGIYGKPYLGAAGSGDGTLFSLTLPRPLLTIIRSTANVILSWPTNAAGLSFTLQSTTNLVSPAVWTSVSPASAVVSGQNTVTNPISGAQQFYRLSQ